MPCSKRVECMVRVSHTCGQGSWKIGRGRIGPIFLRSECRNGSYPRVFKDGHSSFHGSFSICHIYFTIPRNKLNPSPSIFESASPDFCSKHFEDGSLWKGMRVFLKYLGKVNSFLVSSLLFTN